MFSVLTELHIENVAVIRRSDIAFGPGLNVLTGETGAGKSIVIDSLGAILGGRVSREIVRTGSAQASVTAVFTPSEQSDAWLADNGIEPEDELIIRRRISADGRSACRVNGEPVSAAQLRALGALLVDVHGQNDGRRLMDEANHRRFLDGFGRCGGELSAFTAAYGKWKATAAEISSLEMDAAEKERLTERLRAEIDELERAALRDGEYDELEARRGLMRNSEKLTEYLDGAYEALYGGDDSAVSLCGSGEALAARAAEMMPELSGAVENLRSAAALMDDAAETIRDLRDGLDFSPEEYDRLEERASQLRRLFKKYSRGEPELMTYLDECRSRLDSLEYSDDTVAKLRRRLASEEAEVKKAGAALTEARRKAARELEERIEAELRDLSMPSARFKVDITSVSAEAGFNSTGCDEVRFLMSANSGMELGRISRIASGGELSRIMLAMKSVLAESDSVDTMVFDEIDTGVSGIAAQRVGEKLAKLALGRQVLCVTHLPQIAAMADEHFRIVKSDTGSGTETAVEPLDRGGRVAEIARLTGGDVVTETTRKSAAELLDAAADFKKGGF